MPKQTDVKTNFSNGELSPRAYGRFDFVKYPNSAKKIENFLINQMGGLQRSPGTRYVANVKDSSAQTRLIPFQFNSAQAYLLEFGNMYMRFYTQGAQVIVPPSPPIDANTIMLSHFDGINGATAYTAEIGGAFSFFGSAQIDTSQAEFGVSSLKLSKATSDRVTLPTSSIYAFGTNDFAVDFWARFATTPSTGVPVCIDSTLSGVTLNFVNATTLRVFVAGSNQDFTISAVSTGVWYHFEVDRSSGSVYVFMNGVQQDTNKTLNASVANTDGVFFGCASDISNFFDGWIDEPRISNVSRHTANFTPPTFPYGGAATWLTGTLYHVGDYVNHSGTIYICLIQHTSGTFATDLAAGDWTAQTAYEISTPYALADVPAVQYSQNADVMYLYHPKYPTQKLTRLGATSFTLAAAPFIRGPFLPTNTIAAQTITASADTGTNISLTAASSLFVAGNVGTLWRIKNGVVKITVFNSSTVVHGDVQAEPSGVAGNLGTGPGATTDWAEGAFSSVRGYPGSGTFHQQRHYLAATTYKPQYVWGTYLGAYDNFLVDNTASASLAFEIVSDQVNSIKWLNSDADSLKVGTSGGTFSLSSGTQGIAITPTNVNATKGAGDGTAALLPKRISSFLYYVSKSLFKLFELTYNYLVNRDVTSDMTLTADHILRDGSGALDIAYQQTPNDRIWIIRNDGQIAILTRNTQQDIAGWVRRIAGVDSTTTGVFESIAIIQQDSQDDQVWVTCKRQINGVVNRFVEYFTPEYFTNIWDPVLLDASLTLNNPIAITAASQANPCQITAPAHGLSNGNKIKIDGVVGMTNLNGNYYLVAGVSGNTFTLENLDTSPVDSTAFSKYISGGSVRLTVTSLSGLSYLNGESVYVQGDGLTQGPFTVSGGAITLTTAAAVVTVGLPFTSKLQLLKYSGQTAKGTGQTKPRVIIQMVARVSQSLGFDISQDGGIFTSVPTPTGLMYDGDIDVQAGGFNTWFDTATEIVFQQTKPTPLNILALISRQDVDEAE